MQRIHLHAAIALVLVLGPTTASADSEVDLLSSAAEGYARLVGRLNTLPPPPVAPSAGLQRPVRRYNEPSHWTPIYRAPQTAVSRMAKEPPYAWEIRGAARRYGIAPALLFAIVETESNFDPNAVSPKGARGLGQVMPRTARDMGISPERLWHPAANMEASARYLRWLANRYRLDTDRVLVGYNAGPTVADGLRRVPQETRVYVRKVKMNLRKYITREWGGGTFK